MNIKRSILISGVATLLTALPAYSGAVRGLAAGGTTFAANDDGSVGPVALGFSVNFFGSSGSTVFVNNNGNVTFISALSTFTPSGLSGITQPIIAPFFADVDTRGAGSGLTTYATGTITDGLLGWAAFDAFAVSWPAVGYFSSQTNKLNTFELILVNRADTGAGNFDIEFNYDVMQWETGGASGGTNGLGGTSAAAGFSNGLSGGSDVTYQLPGSLVNGALIDGGGNALTTHALNSSTAGRYDFQVRNGVVNELPPVESVVPEPGTIGLFAAGLIGLFAAARRRQ